MLSVCIKEGRVNYGGEGASLAEALLTCWPIASNSCGGRRGRAREDESYEGRAARRKSCEVKIRCGILTPWDAKLVMFCIGGFTRHVAIH